MKNYHERRKHLESVENHAVELVCEPFKLRRKNNLELIIRDEKQCIDCNDW